MNELRSIVKTLFPISMRRNGLNLKKTGLSLMRWENIFPVCPMLQQWWARNMRTLYGE